jgi:hypothetical protein
MVRLAVCLLIVLTTTSFQVSENVEQVRSSGLLEKIAAARKQLEGESVELVKGVVGTRKVRVGRRKFADVPVTGILGREMALAVLDGEGEIKVARAVKRDSGLEVITPGFTLSLRRENGINSDIACIIPAGGKVLAVKYPVSNEGGRFGGGEAVIQAVYTPYSAEIKSEEVIEHGIKVQNDLIDKAYERLDRRGVLSRAFAGRKVVAVVPKEVIRVLLMNEHIDPAEFKTAGLTRGLVEKVITIIATNREKAYAYSVSSAGARGLIQMIPSTYSLIVNKYSSAGLMSNFAAGMADPVNAIMAQVLLCDSDWQAIQSRADIGADRVGPYLAAAYNGGVGRVLSVLAGDQEEWMDDPDPANKPTRTVTQKVAVRKRTKRGRVRTAYVLKSYTQPIFKSETSKYVSQYHWINDFFEARNDEGNKTAEGVK